MEKTGMIRMMVIGFVAMAVVALGSAPTWAQVAPEGVAVSSTGLQFDVDGNLLCGSGMPGDTWATHDDWAPPSTGVPGSGQVIFPCPAGSKAIFSKTGPVETNSGELAAVRFQDKAFSSTDDIFGLGSKQEDTSTWTYVNQKAPGKTDIGNVYAMGRINPLGTAPWAIMGFERLTGLGNAHLDYELNQLPFVPNAGGFMVPNRCTALNDPLPGCNGPDIILAVDDGTSVIPMLRVFKWVGNLLTSGKHSGSQGTFIEIIVSDALRATNSDTATNSGAIPAGPWGVFNSSGTLVYNSTVAPTPISADTFSEVAIDLGVVTGITAGCPGGFSTLFIKSRSSQSVTSELKDRIAPIAFSLDICGTLTIKKLNNSDPAHIVPLGGATFLITPDPNTGIGSLSVTDGGVGDADGVANGTITFTRTVPTTYTIVETAAPVGMIFTSTSQSCVVPNTGTGTCTVTFNNHGLPNLTTSSKSAIPPSGSSVVSGQTITYTVNAINTGNAPALNTVITDVVSPLLTNLAIFTGSGSISGNTVTFVVGTVPAGQTISVSFTAKVISPLANATILNKGTIAFDSVDGPMSQVTNQTTHLVGPPALAITKAVDKATAAPSDSLTYTLNYSNTGGGDATGVTITDVLPPKISFVSATGGGVYATSTNTVTWGIGTLLHGGTGSVTFTVKLDSVFPSGTTSVTNSAVISGTGLPSTPSNPVTTNVAAAPILKLTKVVDKATASPSDFLTYTLTYTNTGNAAASSVVITDIEPLKTTFVSATGGGVFATSTSTVSWAIGTVPALGGTGSVTFTVKLDAVFPNGTTLVKNSAVLSSAELPPTPSVSVTTTVTAAPVLKISKTAVLTQRTIDLTNTAKVTSVEDTTGKTASLSNASVVKGTDILYTIAFANNGNADASSVVISDPLPAGSSFVVASGGGVYNAVTNTVTWAIGPLPSGATGSVTLTARVGQ